MKLFVWDFHSTLEKGNEDGVVIVSNQILEKYGYEERFTHEDGEKLSGLPWHAYFSHLLPYEDKKRHIELQNACVSFSSENAHIFTKCLKSNDHAEHVLDKIAKSNHQQIIISNMQHEALKQYLQITKIENYFTNDCAFGVDEDNTHSTKETVLKMFIHQKDFAGIVAIGDSPRDVALANMHENGKSYLYSHPGKPFRDCHADYKINDLREILKEV